MKKIIVFMIVFSMLFCITACGSGGENQDFDKGSNKNTAPKNPSKNDDDNETNNNPDANQQGGVSAENPYVISTADELYKFVEDYNDFKLDGAIYVKLGADIVVNDIATASMDLTAENLNGYRMWTPVNYFRGTFDGDGHTISGIVCSMDTDEKGTIVCSSALFAYMAEGSVVKNLTVKDSIFTSKTKNYAASICGILRKGTIENCSNYARILTYGIAGGIVASNESGVVKNCNNYGNIQCNGNDKSGGIVARNSGGEVTNCSNYAEITGTSRCLGGICGSSGFDYDTGAASKIVNCVNYSNLTGASVTAGIVGYNTSFVEGCINKGEINGGSYTAGIVYHNGGTNGDEIGDVVNCINYGNVSGTGSSGGISVGNKSIEEGERIYGIRNCINYGNVSGGGDSGGICVYTSYAVVANCANWGNVTVSGQVVVGGAAASGICVSVRKGSKIYNSFNAGDVTGFGNATGLCDGIEGEVSQCYSTGIISSEKASACGITTWLFEGKVLNCFFIGKIYGDAESNYLIEGLYEGDYIDRGYTCASSHLNNSLAKDPAWYIGFDFEEVWIMDPSSDYGYPTLKNMPEDFTK